MARLIETNTSPMQQVEVDLVTLDLVENALRNARYEMDEVLFRTALSPGIREQHDEFPLIANRDGKMMVGQFGLSIPDFLDNFDGTIEEGDVLLTSDPYSCGAAISHANDWLVVMPIFFDGRIVGWSSSPRGPDRNQLAPVPVACTASSPSRPPAGYHSRRIRAKRATRPCRSTRSGGIG